MTTATRNGHIPTAIVTIPTIEPHDARAELDAWHDALTTLSGALARAAELRRTIEALSLQLDRMEASHALSIEGGNAEIRKAKLTLALADDDRYERTRTALAQARHDLADTDRLVTVCKEMCRLHRAALALHTSTDE